VVGRGAGAGGGLGNEGRVAGAGQPPSSAAMMSKVGSFALLAATLNAAVVRLRFNEQCP